MSISCVQGYAMHRLHILCKKHVFGYEGPIMDFLTENSNAIFVWSLHFFFIMVCQNILSSELWLPPLRWQPLRPLPLGAHHSVTWTCTCSCRAPGAPSGRRTLPAWQRCAPVHEHNIYLDQPPPKLYKGLCNFTRRFMWRCVFKRLEIRRELKF